MKKLLVCMDDDTFNLLVGEVNKSEAIRNAIKLYKSDISTDSIEGFREAFKKTQESTAKLAKGIQELESKIDYIARQLQ